MSFEKFIATILQNILNILLTILEKIIDFLSFEVIDIANNYRREYNCYYSDCNNMIDQVISLKHSYIQSFSQNQNTSFLHQLSTYR